MTVFVGKNGAVLKVAGVVAVVGAAAAAMVMGGGGGGASAGAAPEALRRPATIVQLTQAREMDFNESISSDGTIKSRFYSLVSPRREGIIDAIFVREGDGATKDRTVLFQIDNEKLRQEVDKAKQSLIIAKSTLDEKKANLVKAEADLSQAEKDFARTRSLYEQKVVPLSEFEVHETKVVQLKAQRTVAETMVTLAEQNVTLAEILQAMAEKDLRDSVMSAPIDGVISARHCEPGEIGTPGNPILRIDDTTRLKAVAYLPAQFYPRINTGASVANVSVHGKHIGDFPITYKAPAIDSALRTFEIWADIPGDGSYSVPGAQCVIKVILHATRGIGVPRDAIQFRGNRHWVFIPDGDAAKMVEVKKGLDTDGWSELIDPPFEAGQNVVTQGQFLLEDGYPIRERGKIGE